MLLSMFTWYRNPDNLEFVLNNKTVLADVRQVSVRVDDPAALQAAILEPESVLMIGDRLKMSECRYIEQQTPGVMTPYTVNSETGALGQEITKLFTTLRRLTAEEGASFGRVIDGDLRVVELGSWLHPTKAGYFCSDCRCCSGSGRRPRSRAS